MALDQATEGPIVVGTVINRRNSHVDPPVDGTMEVVEFEEDRVMGVVINDGPNETRGRALVEAQGSDKTLFTMKVDMPWLDASTDPSMIKGLMQRSVLNIKNLIESET